VPWPSTIVMQQEEVAKVFSIPLEWLSNHDNLDIKHREFRSPPSSSKANDHNDPSHAPEENTTRHPVVYYHEYAGELLWGATARMTLNLTNAIAHGQINLPL